MYYVEIFQGFLTSPSYILCVRPQDCVVSSRMRGRHIWKPLDDRSTDEQVFLGDHFVSTQEVRKQAIHYIYIHIHHRLVVEFL